MALAVYGTALSLVAAPPASKPAGPKAPADDLDYWLGQAKPAATQPASTTRTGDANAGAGVGVAAAAGSGGSPFAGSTEFRRDDALPGVIELSDGRQLPGGLYTTREKPWIVWQEKTQSWRHIPFINVLSITAVVEEERMELVWRWKGMGEPEKVYTGEKYPIRRLAWRFRLLDGSVVEGETKGQPVWVECKGSASGPFVLHERMKGPEGTTLKDLVYVKKIVVSRKMLDAVAKEAERAAN